MKKTNLIWIIGIIILSSFAYAKFYEFQPDATIGTDTRITSETGGGTNYGTATTISISRESGSTILDRVLMNFNYTCIGITNTTNISLQLYWWQTTDGNIRIYPMNGSWGEETVTWDNCGAGGCAGKYNNTWNISLTSSWAGTGLKNFTLNSTWYNQECAKAQNLRYGFIILGNEVTDSDTDIMYSSDYVTISERPKLYIDSSIFYSLVLTFKDEISNALIGGETFSLFLEKTNFSQTYSTSDNPLSLNLSNGIYKLSAYSANYPSRNYLNIDVSETISNKKTIYLVNATNGAEKSFLVTDSGISPLDGVSVAFTRTIDGIKQTIAEEETDYAGRCKLYLDENYEYTINFSKSGYATKTISLEPSDDSYPIILESSTEEVLNKSLGITYKFTPLDSVLNNNTRYNFTFQLNSSYWILSNCTLRLYNDTILLNETSVYTTPSCYIRIEQDTDDMTTIRSEAIYELDSLYSITVSNEYEVIYTYEGQFSLKNFLDDLTDFGMAGFDSFGRIMIALIVIFVVTALAAMRLGFTSPESLIPLIWALVGFFSYISWFYLDYDSIPDITGLRKWIIFILTSLVALGFFIEKWGR